MSTYSNYQNAYKKASVNTLDQNKLIIMLYDGAIKNANFAVQYMESGEIEKVHDSLITVSYTHLTLPTSDLV